MLGTIGALGEWATAMGTFAQVLVATLITLVFGVALGVWAAESRTVDRILRPVNDVLQTLPQLVYIIPFIYLMPVSQVPGVVASVLYAVPVVIRLVASGLRAVSPEAVEAADAFGATRRQILLKVKIPTAMPVDGSASALMSGTARTRPPRLPGALASEFGTTPRW